MQGRKYFWENDYVDSAVVDGITLRNITVKPSERSLEDVVFSAEMLEPVLACINEVIAQQGKFIVIGDYDMDGLTATTIVVRALRLLGADVSYYIPNRFTDGYGVNADMLTRLHKAGATCFITVDNGIVGYDAAERAQTLGVPLIITDHHLPGQRRPKTPYILHPALDEGTRDIDMCGASVAYILTRSLLQHHECWVTVQHELLQLAALGTIADMMPLDIPWNRALSYHGFVAMRASPLLLLSAFLRLQGRSELSSDDLSFGFIPTMNAVGRMGDSNVVVTAFLSTDEAEIEQLMQSFIACNMKRKEMTDSLYDEILSDLTVGDGTDVGFLLVLGADWHQGILGIVAQRVMQHIGRPVIILTNSKEDTTLYTGSARAFGSYSVKDCFDAAQAVLHKGGGHAYAGGLSVKAAQVEQLRTVVATYNEQLIETMSAHETRIGLTIDVWMPLRAIDEQFLARQDGFAPYGERNKKFVIGVKHVQVIKLQELGMGQKHVKLHVVAAGKTYQIIAFHMFDLIAEIAPYAFVDLVIEVGRNTFNGRTHMQYLLLDIRSPRRQIFDLRQQARNNVPLTTERGNVIVDEVPIDKTAFLTTLKTADVERIYVRAMPFENELLYADDIAPAYFAFVYKYMRQKKSVNLDSDEVYRELIARKIPKSIFLYILQVFFELNFVIIENNVCSINLAAQKTDLKTSTVYNEMKEWLRFRTTLLTGTIDTLYETLTMQ
jgi:single-stranded-DNA-specific exonuclease